MHQQPCSLILYQQRSRNWVYSGKIKCFWYCCNIVFFNFNSEAVPVTGPVGPRGCVHSKIQSVKLTAWHQLVWSITGIGINVATAVGIDTCGQCSQVQIVIRTCVNGIQYSLVVCWLTFWTVCQIIKWCSIERCSIEARVLIIPHAKHLNARIFNSVNQ